MRRLATIALVAASTASGILYWLHDGDLRGAVEPVLPAWTDRVTQAIAADRAVDPAGPPPTLKAGLGGPEATGEVKAAAEGERP
jgi:hypothetical protein